MRRRNEVAVGILLTVAVIVLITGTLWLVRGGLRSGYPLFTRFTWGQNLKNGQEVLLAGVTVGFVSEVRLNPDGHLDVDIKIRKEYKVPRNAVAEVYPVGIFGDVAVALKPTNGPVREYFKAGDTIPSRAATGGMDALSARADTITASLERISAAVELEVVRGGGLSSMRQAAHSINTLVAELRTIAAEQDKNFTATLATFRRSAAAVDSTQIASTLTSFRRTSANVDSLAMRLSSNTTQLQAIMARLERGEGTAGKLLTDSLLYRDARRVLNDVDSLVVDFKKNPKKYISVSIF